MIPRQQNLRSRAAFPLPGQRILVVFQQSGLERFLLKGGLVPRNSGQQTHNRLGHRHGCDLTPSQHKIPDGNLAQAARTDHPLVQPLEPATHHHHARAACQVPRQFL